MNFIRFFAGLLVLILVSCAAPEGTEPAAVAGSSEQVETAQETSSGDDDDELICRREQVTGTNFRRRVCLTRAQRRAIQEETQEEVLERRSAQRIQ